MTEELLKWLLAQRESDIDETIQSFALDTSLSAYETQQLVRRLDEIGVDVGSIDDLPEEG